MKKIVLLAFVLMFLSVSIFSTQIAVSGHATPDVYPGESIQDAINSAQPGDTIFVLAGTYYEHVVVNKTVSLIGEDGDTTIIDGNGTGIVVRVTANNVVIREFTVENGNTGIYLDHSNDSTVRENNVIYNVDAIFVRFSNNCTIYQNLVGNNTHRGILVTDSWHFTISNNKVYDNGWYGINANASVNGVIVENEACENYYDGIGLLNSNNCTVARNNVSDNLFFGIWLDSSDGNFIHHNNIISNGIQATTTLSTNRWDNGVAGNYWSDYEDRYPNATELDGSSIWNIPYVIDANNQDRYPLMTPVIIPEFPDTTPPTISIVSPENKTYAAKDVSLNFTVSEPTTWIGYSLDGQANVTIDGNTTLTELSDGTHSLVVYSKDTVGNTGTSETIYFSIETQLSEPFPTTWIVATIAIIAVAGSTLLVYFRKIRKSTEVEKKEQTPEGVM